MRWSDRRADEPVAEATIWLVVFLAVCGIVVLLATSIGHAQTFYSTEDGTGFALELMPGVTYFAGPRSGFAIETAPGVTRYDLHDADLNSSRGTLYNLSPEPEARRREWVRPDRERPTWERESLLDDSPRWGTR